MKKGKSDKIKPTLNLKEKRAVKEAKRQEKESNHIRLNGL